MQLERNKIWSVLFGIVSFLSIYASSSIISNALYSNSMAVLFILTVYTGYKSSLKTIQLPDRFFSLVYFSFFVLLIVDALLLGQRDSLLLALKYVYWSVVPFLVFYFSLQRYFQERTLIAGISLGLFTLCSYGFYQFMIFPLGTRIKSYIYHPNAFAQFLILSIPFLIVYLIHRKKRSAFSLAIGAVVLLSCFLLVLSGSRGAIVGFCLGGLLCLLVQLTLKKKLTVKMFRVILAVLLLMAALGGVFAFNFENTKLGAVRPYDHERVLLWQSGCHMWQDHKLLGVGLNRWPEEYKEHYISPAAKEPNLKHPHNTCIYFFATTGLLGGCGYLLFTFGVLVYVIIQLKKHPENIFLSALLWTFLAVMIHGLVDSISKDELRLLNTYLGIALASSAYETREEEKHPYA